MKKACIDNICSMHSRCIPLNGNTSLTSELHLLATQQLHLCFLDRPTNAHGLDTTPASNRQEYVVRQEHVQLHWLNFQARSRMTQGEKEDSHPSPVDRQRGLPDRTPPSDRTPEPSHNEGKPHGPGGGGHDMRNASTQLRRMGSHTYMMSSTDSMRWGTCW